MTTPATRTLLTAARDALAAMLAASDNEPPQTAAQCADAHRSARDALAQLNAALVVPCAGCGCPPHAPNECPTMLQVNEARRRVRCRCDHGAALAVPAVEWHSDGDAGAWADFGMFLLTIERTHDRAGFFWNLHLAGEEPSGYADTLDAAKAAAERAAGVK